MNRPLKTLACGVALALAGLVFSGCGGGGDGLKSNGSISPQMLVGTWPIESITYTSKSAGVHKTVCADYPASPGGLTCTAADYLRFNADGTFVRRHIAIQDSLTEYYGTWSLHDNALTLNQLSTGDDRNGDKTIEPSELSTVSQFTVTERLTFQGANSFTSVTDNYFPLQPDVLENTMTTVYRRADGQ